MQNRSRKNTDSPSDAPSIAKRSKAEQPYSATATADMAPQNRQRARSPEPLAIQPPAVANASVTDALDCVPTPFPPEADADAIALQLSSPITEKTGDASKSQNPTYVCAHAGWHPEMGVTTIPPGMTVEVLGPHGAALHEQAALGIASGKIQPSELMMTDYPNHDLAARGYAQNTTQDFTPKPLPSFKRIINEYEEIQNYTMEEPGKKRLEGDNVFNVSAKSSPLDQVLLELKAQGHTHVRLGICRWDKRESFEVRKLLVWKDAPKRAELSEAEKRAARLERFR